MLVVIGTDCIGSCISNYHMIMTTTAPDKLLSNLYITNHISIKLLRAASFFPLMNSAYTFNLYIKGTFSGSLENPLYTGLTIYGHKINWNVMCSLFFPLYFFYS
jgi:hypothetical protein